MALFDPKKIAGGLAKGAVGAAGALVGVAGFAKDQAVAAAGAASKAVAAGAANASEKASIALQERKENWYHPVFLDQYQATDFDMPKLIVIADEDIRKGNEFCEGAIGWLNTRRVPEIIFMYEEFVEQSGVQFSPRPMCGCAYYRHPFNKDLYLPVKDYISICKRDQLTELKNIACMLGAVHCSVEVLEDKGIVGKLGSVANMRADAPIAEGAREKATYNEETNVGVGYSSSESLKIEMNEYFEAGATPQRPELQWFKNDNEILSLIEKRCNPDAGGVLSKYSIDITSSASSSISIDLASKIDASLGAASVKVGSKLTAGLKRDEKKRFFFKIEF